MVFSSLSLEAAEVRSVTVAALIGAPPGLGGAVDIAALSQQDPENEAGVRAAGLIGSPQSCAGFVDIVL